MIHRIVSVGLLAILPACLAGCADKAPAANPNATAAALPQVVAAKPERKTLRLTTTQPAQIEAFEQTPLYARVPGYVAEVLVEIGDAVKKNQPLIRLSAQELLDDVEQREALVVRAKAEIKQAESAVAAAKAVSETAQARIAEMEAAIGRFEAERERWKSEYARTKDLVAKGSVTKKLEEETQNSLRAAEAAHLEAKAKTRSAQAGYVEAQANVGKAQADQAAAEARLRVAAAELAHAKTMAGYLEIKAPYDGTVTRRSVDTGHYVFPVGSGGNKPLVVMVRTDQVRVVVEVPELEAAQVDVGDTAMVRIQALEGKEFAGKVARTGWSLADANRSLRTEIDVASPQGILRPGLYASATIILDERHSALILPTTAIVRESGQAYCLVLDKGHVHRTPVTLGLRSGGDIEVVTGVDETQLVIVKQPEAYKEGQQVQLAQPAK